MGPDGGARTGEADVEGGFGDLTGGGPDVEMGGGRCGPDGPGGYTH
jgi:hypothetical protein